MAKVKIQGHASGTGILTVTAPNTSSDRTITLPDSTGTLLDENASLPAANLTGTVASARITAGSIANDLIDSQHYAAGSIDNEHLADDAVDSDEIAAGAIDAAHLASGVGGIVIQHTYASTRTQSVSTSTTATAISGLTVAITPTDATNNLLVTVGVAINKRQAATGTRLWLYRDIGGAGFTIMDGVPIIYYGGYDAATSADSHNNVFFQYLDSSYDSTSEVTYKPYYALSNGSGTIKINSNGSLSTITVTEHKV